MKLPTVEELQGHDAATYKGAVEGLVAGLVVGVPASYLMHTRWHYYRHLPPSIKALGIVLIAAPVVAIQAERRGLQFDKSHWEGAGEMALERQRHLEEQRLHSLSMRDRVGDWAYRHKYSLIFGAWVASMGASWLVVSRHKTESFGQKIVQARVYAQGFTVATVLGAAMMSHSQKKEQLKKAAANDHSWRVILEEQEKEALRQKQQTAAAA